MAGVVCAVLLAPARLNSWSLGGWLSAYWQGPSASSWWCRSPPGSWLLYLLAWGAHLQAWCRVVLPLSVVISWQALSITLATFCAVLYRGLQICGSFTLALRRTGDVTSHALNQISIMPPCFLAAYPVLIGSVTLGGPLFPESQSQACTPSCRPLPQIPLQWEWRLRLSFSFVKPVLYFIF